MALATRPGAPQFPTTAGAIPPTDHAALDAAVATLQARKDAWVALGVADRIALLDRLIADFAALTPRWVAASLQAKGLAPDAPAATPLRAASHADGPPHEPVAQSIARAARATLVADCSLRPAIRRSRKRGGHFQPGASWRAV